MSVASGSSYGHSETESKVEWVGSPDQKTSAVCPAWHVMLCSAVQQAPKREVWWVEMDHLLEKAMQCPATSDPCKRELWILIQIWRFYCSRPHSKWVKFRGVSKVLLVVKSCLSWVCICMGTNSLGSEESDLPPVQSLNFVIRHLWKLHEPDMIQSGWFTTSENPWMYQVRFWLSLLFDICPCSILSVRPEGQDEEPFEETKSILRGELRNTISYASLFWSSFALLWNLISITAIEKYIMWYLGEWIFVPQSHFDFLLV